MANMKFSKDRDLKAQRQEFLNAGDDMLLSFSNPVNELANRINPNHLILVLKSKVSVGVDSMILSFVSRNGEELPPFKAGQKITLTIEVDKSYLSGTFYLTSIINNAIKGEYQIGVKRNESVITSFLLDKIKINDYVIASSPFGDFTYDINRDLKKVIAIFNDTGVFPILSMLRELKAGLKDYKMTLFYSEKNAKDFICLDELRSYEEEGKIKLIPVLMNEEKRGFSYGVVSHDMVEKYLDKNTSIFIAGNEGLLKYLDKELKVFDLPKKRIRYASFLPNCSIKKVVEYKCTIYIKTSKYEIKCYNNRTLMDAIMEAGIFIPNKCHDGSCGYCRSELVLGKVKVINDKRKEVDQENNYIHPCVSYPLSDIELVIR